MLLQQKEQLEAVNHCTSIAPESLVLFIRRLTEALHLRQDFRKKECDSNKLGACIQGAFRDISLCKTCIGLVDCTREASSEDSSATANVLATLH